jgi:hypothetical protein
MKLPENPYREEREKIIRLQGLDAWLGETGVGEDAYERGQKDALKAFIEWGEETCPHSDPLEGYGATQCYKHACGLCWNEIKKQLEGK